MKQLLYTICFGACALSFFDMHAGLVVSTPENQLQLIEEQQRKEKVELLSYDYAALLDMIDKRIQELEVLRKLTQKTYFCGGAERQAKFKEIEEYKKAHPELLRWGYDAMSAWQRHEDFIIPTVISMAKKANLPKRTSPLTRTELTSIMYKVKELEDAITGPTCDVMFSYN